MLGRVRAINYAVGRCNVQLRQIGFMGKKAVKQQPEPLPDRSEMTLEELKKVDPVTGVDRSRWTFKYDKELLALANRLGFSLEKLPSLQTALIHRSAVTKERSAMGEVNKEHNGRLVVLGNSSIEHYISEFLYCTYPNLEGHAMCDVSMFIAGPRCSSYLANYLGVANLVVTRTEPLNAELYYVTGTDMLSESDVIDKSNVPVDDATLSNYRKSSVLSRTFRAVIGAVYVDQGPRAARELIHTLFVSLMKELDIQSIIKLSHPKFTLCKLLEQQGKPAPVARLIAETGRLSHFPTFHIGMYSGERLLGTGMGSSKARAESEAASTAVRKHYLKQLKKVSLPSDYDDFIPERSFTLMTQVNPKVEKIKALFQ